MSSPEPVEIRCTCVWSNTATRSVVYIADDACPLQPHERVRITGQPPTRVPPESDG